MSKKNLIFLVFVASNLVSVILALAAPYIAQAFVGPHITLPFSAAFYGEHEMLKPWLESGGDPNERDLLGTLLQNATSTNGNFETVALLLRYGADPNLLAEIDDRSPLILAAKYGDFGTFVLLLENGADPAHKAHDGESVETVLASQECPYAREKVEYLKRFLAGQPDAY